MALFSLFQKKAIDFFSPAEQERISAAIQAAEKMTSGEVRVFIEHYCANQPPVHRAAEIFHSQKMDKTVARNGVLVYLAVKHKKLAIYGDTGINVHVAPDFWEATIHNMQQHFKKADYVAGIVNVIETIGRELAKYFPYDPLTDKNDLPDELVFGKK